MTYQRSKLVHERDLDIKETLELFSTIALAQEAW